jgi:hypothetical protein
MKTTLRHVMPSVLALMAACSGNNLEVGNVPDAGPADSAVDSGGGSTGPLQCEYQGRLYNDGEARVDACSWFCDGKTGQFVQAILLCKNDAGAADTAEAWCEYKGVSVSERESFPASDGCNLCSCIFPVGQVTCTLRACLPGEVGTGLNKLAACPSWGGSVFVTLGTILGVGKSPTTGTIYVVDQVGTTQRVFVSISDDVTSALILKRQVVAGSGSSQDFLVFTTDGPDATVTVQIDTPAGQPKRMGVMPGILKDRKTLVIGQDGEELTVLNDSDIAGIYLRNLPRTVTTEYVASTEDGYYVVVVRPTYDWTFDDFRVYFGTAAKMSERDVVNVTRYWDGGTTQVAFNLNGSTTTAYFPVIQTDGGFGDGPATLTIGSQTLPLTRLSAPPADAIYVCGASPAQCHWPATEEAKDAGSENQCRAARFLATCDLGNGTQSSGLRDTLEGCSNNCADNEYGVACGTVGPSSSPTPDPPAGCHAPLHTPGGVSYYCCPCL